jgi:hypothetical protein
MRFVVFIVFAFCFLSGKADVEIITNPDMTFRIINKMNEKVQIVNVLQLVSDDSTFQNFDTLFALGKQKVEYSDKHVYSTAYEYTKFHKLKIIFNDKARVSNVFEQSGFSSEYNIVVYEDSLEIIDVTPFWERNTYFYTFLKYLIVTILIELLVGFIYLFIYSKPYSILYILVLVNLLTTPISWLLLPLFLGFKTTLITGLLFAILFEGFVFHKTANDFLSWKRAYYMSIYVNIVRFIVLLIVKFSIEYL